MCWGEAQYIKCLDAPESRMVYRSHPVVILAWDGGSCSGRMTTLYLAYVIVGCVCVCVRVR